MPNNNYPDSVRQVLDDTLNFRSQALRAVRTFARSRPWRGSLDEQQQKVRLLHAALCHAYCIRPTPQLIFANDGTCSGRSCFIGGVNVIILRGRLSVVSYLHEFAHARGMNEYNACRWSINLFRRCFPRSWANARFEGHMVRSNRRASSSPK